MSLIIERFPDPIINSVICIMLSRSLCRTESDFANAATQSVTVFPCVVFVVRSPVSFFDTSETRFGCKLLICLCRPADHGM